MAVEYGTGYVTIVPSAKGIKGKLEAELGGPELSAAAENAGDEAGSKFGGGFSTKAKIGAAAAGAAFVAVLATGIGDALDQGAVTDKLAAKLDLDPAQSARAGKVAGDLYTNAYGDSFEDVAGQLEGTLRTFGTDLTDAEAFGLTAGSIDLTTAFDVDPERLAATTGLVLKNGLATSATEAQDIVTAALQGIAAPAGDVLDTLYEFSEPLASLGLTGGAAIGVLSAAADAGVFDLTKAGDAVKEFSIRAVDGSSAVTEAYADLGLDADDFAARIAEGGPAAQQAFGEVLNALDGISDPVAKERAGVALFGTTFEDLGPAAISSLNPLNATINDVTGSTAELGNVLNDNLKTRLETVKRQGFQALATILTAVVLPAVEGLISVIGSVVGFFKENQAVAIGFAAGLGTLAVVIGGPFVVAMLSAVAANIGFAITMIAAALPVLAVASAVGILVAGIIWAYKNLGIFRTAVDSVAGFLTGTLWPAIRTVGAGIGAVFNGAFSAAGTVISGFVGVVSNTGDIFSAVFGGIVSAARTVGDVFGAVFTGAGDVFTGFIGLMGDAAAGVGDLFGAAFSGASKVVGGFISVVTDVGDAVGSGFGAAFNAAISVATTFGSVIGSVAGTVGTVFSGAAARVGTGLRAVGNIISTVFTGAGIVFRSFVTAVTAGVNVIRTVFGTVFAAASFVIQGFVDNILFAANLIGTVFSTALTGAIVVFDLFMAAASLVSEVVNTVLGVAVDAATTGFGLFAAAGQFVADLFTAVLSPAVEAVTTVIDLMVKGNEIAANAFRAVLGAAVTFTTGVVNRFLGIVGTVGGLVNAAAGKAVEAFFWVRDTAADVFAAVTGGINTFVGTLQALPSRVRSAVAGMWDSIKDGAKTAFNAIARFWNSTVGSIGFRVPDWVPGVGGKGFSIPNVPVLHEGGIVPGPKGKEVLIRALGGEGVIDLGLMDEPLLVNKSPKMNVTAYVSDGRQFLDLIARKAALT